MSNQILNRLTNHQTWQPIPDWRMASQRAEDKQKTENKYKISDLFKRANVIFFRSEMVRDDFIH